MNEGWEDWDFWLSLIERGRGVYQIPETLFFYRVAGGASRNRDLFAERARTDRMLERVMAHHIDLYAAHVADLYRNRHYEGMFLYRRERLAARVALAALLRPRPVRGLLTRLTAGLMLLAWAAFGPVRHFRDRRHPMPPVVSRTTPHSRG